MKSRSELGIKPIDIDHEVFDIYDEDQMSCMTSCRLMANLEVCSSNLKMLLAEANPQLQQKEHRPNTQSIPDQYKIHLETSTNN